MSTYRKRREKRGRKLYSRSNEMGTLSNTFPGSDPLYCYSLVECYNASNLNCEKILWSPIMPLSTFLCFSLSFPHLQPAAPGSPSRPAFS
jgi:hypothetical protein